MVPSQEEAQELGLVNRIVPRAQLQQETLATAGLLANFDSFHMEMIKLTCNQAQDAPGLSSGVRSTLSNWGIYRSAASVSPFELHVAMSLLWA